MTKTTVLFLCPDNSLLGPLAEAYLNFRANGLMRAFSAGLVPADHLNRYVERLLSAEGLNSQGLNPKAVDIFLMPHANVPDRVVYLADMKPISLPQIWKTTTSSHWWSIAGAPPFSNSFSAGAAYFKRIRTSIDQLIEPTRSTA
ncbi:MAG: ArsR family transcriptional regulator, partial [Roseibium sp.]|uniref:arsenate-mycothiol transferase ArsC n=1 Tax=Roseibium sp. TaxID=1936156 RepID=UPI002624072D